MAEAYLQNNQLDKAYVFAKKDFDLRTKNIDANALLAEICFKANRIDEAKQYAMVATKTNKKNKVTLEIFKAIYTAARDEKGIATITQALQSI